MTPYAVYDTNVIVSAIIKPGSLPESLVARAMQGAIKLFLSREILQEYEEVLKRPTFGFDLDAVEAFLNNLKKSAIIVYPKRRATSALDEPDNRFLECAEEAKASYIVTGDRKHFPFTEYMGAKIVNPGEFAGIIIGE